MTHPLSATLVIFTVLCQATKLIADVPPAYQRIAREKDIPPALFYAVALAESGQSLWSRKQYRPWPWTLNIEGVGQYFPSRRATWLALKTALNNHKSVDIGLMQVSWRYHQRALGSSWQALDPYHNLRVGAAILHRCFEQLADWVQSLGCYHAPNNPERAAAYRKKVIEQWRELDSRLDQGSTL